MLSKRLKSLRQKEGLTQLELAEKLDIPNQNVSNYERGFRQPDYEMLIKFANFYGVTTDYLLGHETEESKFEYYKNKIITEFPNIDLMFHDMESLTAEDLQDVYEFIKFKKSQKDK